MANKQTFQPGTVHVSQFFSGQRVPGRTNIGIEGHMSAPDHPLLSFASRYGDPSQDYLNAHMAIARLETLMDDLKTMTELLDREYPEDSRWYPWIGAEIISYYAVGFVTCLEWHARSRLVDLLTFQPEAMKVEDVKGTVSDKLIIQMAARKATVAQLVGASIRVGSTENYLSIFGRTFVTLGFPFSVVDWLTGQAKEATTCWIRPEQIQDLARLFEFRHELVHEIGLSTMGHPNVRDFLSPADAARLGRLVTSVVFGVEAAFTRFAPSLFPNLVTEEGWPVSRIDRLKEELERLDHEVGTLIAAEDWGHTTTREDWTKTRAAFQTYMDLEEAFIDTGGMLHWRYFDARTPLRTALVRYRIDFLAELRSHMGE